MGRRTSGGGRGVRSGLRKAIRGSMVWRRARRLGLRERREGLKLGRVGVRLGIGVPSEGGGPSVEGERGRRES
ncbi:hypothetical protein LIER_43239 [Lithospermum erythrorhizon]|uniref:Uncharacterized protein n=1 Tax=Lithospermum erythrorhizon TaxID=34254 RepID=A0AAV3PTQ2_LITER